MTAIYNATNFKVKAKICYVVGKEKAMSNSVAQAEEVLFYEPEDPNGYLSNFAACPIKVDDQVWATSEHYYQAMKFASKALRNTILEASTPAEAFSLSRDYEDQDQVREDWYDIRVEVMQFIVTEKFRQNPQFALFLTNTGDSLIKEHSHKDHFWGDGGDGTGENHLGKILMAVRQQLHLIASD
ncbi:NADAR family protein [Vibrio sp. 10N.261.46.E12]|nr:MULTISPECIES: NADAR family protein [unclassified Vibrio]OMO38523.1 GTP cyclohydrolase [Vibrio sp. 10N.261.45.E1]PMJ24655.1 GTP cyclohydrolase [Vibrio sp. 10N.286.45.B6]PMM69471.1 GTP cyclohydrolase [Vibrio sp. 10N.261.46.F12]PMM85932.1 GTP cyclohydrolase [Vibrio sp. 10N.261.46.E8]PMN29265.1 GTP cyclohydrolase [Vibrio sp. 10N.261.45.E2]